MKPKRLTKEQEAKTNEALFNASKKLSTWLEENAPEEIAELFSEYETLRILAGAGEYAGYTEPGDQARMESVREINRLLQLI